MSAAVLTRRGFLAATGLMCLSGCGAVVAPTVGEIGTAASGVLVKLAQELGLEYLKDGVTWLLENGYEKARDELKPIDDVYREPKGRVAAFGARATVADADVDHIVVLTTPAGDLVRLKPRAAAVLAATWASLRDGSDHLPRKYSNEEIGSYLLPQSPASDVPRTPRGGRSTTYAALGGPVTIEYVPGEGLGTEELTLHTLGSKWTIKLSPETTRL